ncbi:MAG: hypothetical protein A3G24_08845 [Betaproteobacteria bacterium RIFCSPLOWO2_12_FULL_62_13]|nr:MAG: hypothetical protein A3G24_08845 [Betaproteobacteria bacterium RIFCSPLOWO2_12_FULL_62_13]
MNHNERRKRLRRVFNGSSCVSPASVYDPLSARLAQTVGFEIGIFSGSLACATTLAAPDLNLVTLTEFAEQVRRIMRVSDLSLVVDADNGHGNALNTMRTIEELEFAGVSLISIEDLALPMRFSQPEGATELVSLEEMAGKIKAAVRARQDDDLMIAGRTAALTCEGRPSAVARARAYAHAGADAIFLVGAKTLDDIEAVHRAAGLPVIVGLGPPALSRKDMAARGARMLTQGHQPLAAAVNALRETYEHFLGGGSPAELEKKIASREQMEQLVFCDEYRQRQRQYLHVE